jgi:hypothetical protein
MNTSDSRKPKKYEINIEGTLYEWDQPTITVAQIRQLAQFDDSQPIVEVDLHTNTERTLAENETVEVKPGKGFGKKVQFKRG